MRGRLIAISDGPRRRQYVTLELDRDFRREYERLKNAELSIEIRKYRKRRSLSANAYFHVLVHKIAEELGGSEESAKEWLVCEYGALLTDADGAEVALKLPVSVDVSTVYPYAKCIDSYVENGNAFAVYLIYKQTHLMDSREMARLIDGTIEAARELGVETDTPEQLARYRMEWERQKG